MFIEEIKPSNIRYYEPCIEIQYRLNNKFKIHIQNMYFQYSFYIYEPIIVKAKRFECYYNLNVFFNDKDIKDNISIKSLCLVEMYI